MRFVLLSHAVELIRLEFLISVSVLVSRSLVSVLALVSPCSILIDKPARQPGAGSSLLSHVEMGAKTPADNVHNSCFGDKLRQVQ